jgi:hypothetical protein
VTATGFPLIGPLGGGGVPPPAAGDLTKWPRRGATIAASLLDTRWDIDAWAQMLGDIFGGRGLTLANVLSAPWPEMEPFMEMPFVRASDGRWDIRTPNPTFYDRLRRYVDTMNRHGVVVQLCFLELYSWSGRKTGLPFDQNLTWARHNVNGVSWGPGDETFDILPDDFAVELVERVVGAVRGSGCVVVPGNEFPEKRVHQDIAAIVKRVDPSMRVATNRNEDTPGQYANMQVGRSAIDGISYHAWDTLAFLDVDFADEPPDRPRTFRQFFDKRDQNGHPIDVDISRTICSSDGSRASDDPVNTYDWPRLLEVFDFVAGKGGSIDHQSRAKMSPGAQLGMVEDDFLKQIAAL